MGSAPRVSVVMPCAGAVEPRTVQSAMNLAVFAATNGVKISRVGITERTLIHQARNWMSHEFLKAGDDWVFWLDSDMTWEPRTLNVLLKYASELDAKMLTGVYCQRMGEHKPIIAMRSLVPVDGSAVKNVEDEYSAIFIAPERWDTKPFQVDAAGFGCMLIHRSVYESMEYPFFKFLFHDDPKGKSDSYISEDFYFCRQARKRGTLIWAVPELKCGHIGQAPIITHEDFKPDLSKTFRVTAVESPEPVKEKATI